MSAASAPLKGVRVLDLTNVLAGPFCCHQLAHLGAEVIKIEVPGRGDLARQLGADAELNRAGMGVSFLAQNAGKSSLTLNLKAAEGQGLFRKLAAKSDVVVENFRPGVMERLGLSAETLRADNPALIYCAISGFGQDGPLSKAPAYDQIVQGMSGVMSITGDGESAPLRAGYPIADTIGGLTAAMAISAALAGRDAHGQGTVIDVSMLEAVVATMGWVVSNYLIAGVTPHPQGNENATSAPSGLFRTADGAMNIAANKQEQFETLAGLIERADLLDDPRFATREDRKTNRLLLRKEIEKRLAERPTSDWVRALTEAGVPVGPVLSVPDVLAHPQIADRGLLAEYNDVPDVDRPVRTVRTAARFDGKVPSVDSGPPALGADTSRLLEELLGLGAEDQARLRQEGII
ncbi:MAG: CoA transferase [Pseudomonadota bacterium]